MNEHTNTMNESSSDLAKADDILAQAASDEELEAAAGPMITYGTFGGWMSSTPQCCSMGRC
jgi:hypothetical protein